MSALEQAMAEPSLEDRLREVLPPWTHWSGSIFGGFTATWTTTDGTWSIGTGGMPPWPAIEGPGGKWAFGSKDAEHIIGVLRALDAIPETPAGAKPWEPVAGSPTAAGAREADPASLGLGAGSAAPDGSRYPAKYGYCAQCGAEPGQSCHYMFGDGTANQEPNSVRPEPHFYRDSPGDDPNWRNLSAYKGSGTGSADPKPLALDAGICRCGADGHGPGDNRCVCRKPDPDGGQR